MRVLGVIPARRRSKRLPGKNLLTLGGFALWEIAVQQAISAGLTPYVSTDIQEILDYEPLAVRRPAHLCEDDTPIEDVLTHILSEQKGYEGIVVLNPTHPLRYVEDIKLSVEALKSFPSCTGVRKDFSYTIDEGARFGNLNEQGRVPRLFVTGAIYAVRTLAFIEHRKLMIALNVNRGTYHLERGPYVDINTQDDYIAAKALWDHREQLAKDPLKTVFQ